MSYLAYKTKLKLNNRAKTLMGQSAGYGRWVWNWGLDFKQKAYEEGIKLTKSQLRKYYTNYVKPFYPWQSKLSSRIYQYVFIDLDEAMKRFFKGIAKFPRFKKKGKRHKMPLSVRVYDCPDCHVKLDRDFNASLNLENYENTIAVGLTALRSVDGVLPTVPCEADSKRQARLSSFG